MNFKGLTGKLSKNINTIGLAGGALMAFGAAGNGSKIMTTLEAVLSAALSDPHIPNFENVKFDLMQGILHKPLRDSITIALVGEIASTLGLMPKYANLAKKFGWNAAKGVVVADLALRSTIWHSPKTGNPTMTQRNFAKARTVASYGY